MPQANLQLLASGESSDFTIICQGVEFKECHEATLSLPEEDPEILARVLLWLYTGDARRPSLEEEIEQTLAKLVPGGPTTERSEFETYGLVYFCADRQGVESVKGRVGQEIGNLICRFEKKDMDGDFAAFVEKVYNDIPAKDDPLRIQVSVETLKRLWRHDLLWGQDISDDGDDDGDDDNDKDTPERIRALIQENEPSVWKFLTDIIRMFSKADPIWC